MNNLKALCLMGLLLSLGVGCTEQTFISETSSFNPCTVAQSFTVNHPNPATNENFGKDVHFAALSGSPFLDLVISAANSNVGGNDGAGKVFTFLASGAGTFSTPTELTAPVSGANEYFGDQIGVGLINNDAFLDLMIRAPGAGRVFTFMGDGAGGFAAPGTINEPSASTPGLLHSHLAKGRFNNDAFDDLAVGAPAVGSNTGEVYAILSDGVGGAASTTTLASLHSGPLSRFGLEIAAGDFDGDGFTDLAIGAPGTEFGEAGVAGRVHIFMNDGTGVFTEGVNITDTDDDADAGFGRAIRVGDMNGDGAADLVIGSPFARVLGIMHRGRISVHLGNGDGTFQPGQTLFSSVVPEILAPARLGFEIKTGDINHDGVDDIVAGSPLLSVLGLELGGLHVFYMDPLGSGQVIGKLALRANDPQAGELLGESIDLGDYNGDGVLDILAGAPGFHSGDHDAAGRVVTFILSCNGL